MDFKPLLPPADSADPEQLGTLKWFRELGTRQWLPICGHRDEGGVRVGWYSALAPVSYRPQALEKPSWDLLHGLHGPGFSESSDGQGGWTRSYHRISSEPLEPLAIERGFEGIKPAYLELAEEFRLFHNLWQDPSSRGRFLKLDESANETLAAVIEPEGIWVSTPLVRQYQAAKQMDLLLFIDSTVRFDPSLPMPQRDQWVEADLNAARVGSDVLGTPTSLLWGTKVLPAPPMEQCRIWPYEEADEEFPEFILGTDDLGNEVKFTCDPDRLANYFGANPDAPNYITPVYFRRAVLAKYYDRPEVYRVESDCVRCASSWLLRMDNDAADSVIVWLGDLGRDLPAKERLYWLSYNIPPNRPVSNSTYRRAILGEWADSESPDVRFRSEYRDLAEVWTKAYGWPLFREPEPGDVHILDLVRIPLHDSESELEETVGNLTKLLVDFLNEAELAGRLPPGPADEKGIAKLERWLVQAGYPAAERDIGFLRNLQSVRSKGVAHRKGSDYEKVLTRAFGEKRGAAAATKLIENSLAVVRELHAFAESQAKPLDIREERGRD
ncbi:MAG: hypothetical protein ABSA21_13725 [Candidatus Limnocylindrales bacterium]